MFDYTDTEHGHLVKNTGHDHYLNLWRFEHAVKDGNLWRVIDVLHLDLGPSADARQDARERFVLAFPNAYGYHYHRCEYAEECGHEPECWHVLYRGKDLGEEDQGFDTKEEAREFLRAHLKMQG